MRFIQSAAIVLLLSFASNLSATAQDISSGTSNKDMREALKLYDNGMYSAARHAFVPISEKELSSDPEGFALLSQVRSNTDGYEAVMERFFADHPHSMLLPQIRLHHGMNLFDAQDYKGAWEVFSQIELKQIYKKQRTDFLFRKAYCDLENRDLGSAKANFSSVEKEPMSEYTASARYALGYISYVQKDFADAFSWFEKSRKDPRFAKMSNYYIMECRFMLKDYRYVTENGDSMYEAVPQERQPHLARIISESWLVLGDAENARKYLELNVQGGGQPRSRTDWFFRGSVLYAVEDYRSAIDAYSMMGERRDSIGQIADYHLGYSFIQTKNKVAAMDAFKQASTGRYDDNIAEDAFFNWAKLAFDLNNDTSVFQDYLERYPGRKSGDQINSYIAVAALHARDYEAAVNAYDKIDDLDDDMRNNYMKANFLRAVQLISNGSYRKAIPCLKVAAYYSEKGSRFNQLTRFWLAESYYRNDQYAESLEILSDLYNTSALYGRAESYQISYNMAYCYFKRNDYVSAMKWFDEYLGEASVKYKKDAMERKADCLFIRSEYNAAAEAYELVAKTYPDVNDIYPYYQAALSYGLAKNQTKKIEVLARVMDASPESKFYPEAIFELGRTYAVREDDDNAFKCFTTLVCNVTDSTFVAQAYIEMGSIARNQSQFNDALGYYKKVVEEMPLSGYAEDALLAIESIYQTRNEPEEYLAYIETIGKGATKTADEKEDMIFNAAEQIFLSDNYEKALVSLQSYHDKYPNGRHAYKVDFYMAESYKNLDKLEQACDSYRRVIENGEGSFVELSMLNFSNLSYKLEKWEDAYGGYSSLFSSALLENNKFVAMTGMMRSAYRGHDWAKAIECAEHVIYDTRSDEAVKTEAEYVKAKSYLATSRRDEAFAVLERLAKDVSGPYGAEAEYMLIQDCYDRGDFAQVEERVFAFADAESDQVYWLAKSFIVLGDSYAERDEIEQAKATFESVRDGYVSEGQDDDVIDNVTMRLKKIEEMSYEE